ncbi:hypothetical protein [Deinococcus radiophilus]|uniref:DraI n=2 Tax=Deinococcus radiophilus TaxID=32062 RepID=F1KM56_9DEIO|nr:hypothetical protein [Deinococcus radiophilus]ADZ31431.1 DraI [Deinococcus radiophilus]RTR22849.1 hypothetical protein EJ104_12685 [Deinococcus radiophilus]UFA50537.1 hypothetical protein LMT64_01055 [Deinococcus radiophilus]
MSEIDNLVNFILSKDGIGDKSILEKEVIERFSLTRDRSVYYCTDFAIRFSSSKSAAFSNTVLSLSNLRKFDSKPFIVCLITPAKNYLFLANTSFLKKISHSSQTLTSNNIRGSFNGSDIYKDFDGIPNSPENFEYLFRIHAETTFEENLIRLAEATNDIAPSGKKFVPSPQGEENIYLAPKRASEFIASDNYRQLLQELDDIVRHYTNEIIIASMINNVNIRGRVIEYLVAGEDDLLRQNIIYKLRNGGTNLPQFKTDNSLGDYSKAFEGFDTETDVKTKIMLLNSNPKAYNLDKILNFLSSDKSVFLFYFIGIDSDNSLKTCLVTMFNEELLRGTITLRHWAGRNSRGVSQFDGKIINNIILNPSNKIDKAQAREFLTRILSL